MTQPLYTQPAIDYLDSIIQPTWRVFEFGAGGSTTYYYKRCAEVRAMEHDAAWVITARSNTSLDSIIYVGRDGDSCAQAKAAEADFFAHDFDLPLHPTSQVESQYHGMENTEWREYAGTIFKWPQGYFDVIVVDGMARSLCLYYAAQCVKQYGMIILDNSCRWQYNDVQEHIINQGWNRRDFWQPNHPGWCTSFFSKSFDSCDQPVRRANNVGDLYHAMGW